MSSTRISVLATLLLALVCTPATAATLYFDFGDSGSPSAGSNYNDVIINNNPQPIVLANTIDSTGASAGIGLTVSGFFPGSNTTGTTTPGGAAAATFVVSSTRDNAFTHESLFSGQDMNPKGTLTFSGLNDSTAYDFTFFAARAGVGDNRETKYTVTGSTSTFALLNPSNNNDNLVSVLGIHPNAGSISIDVEAGPNNNNGTTRFAYLGALKMDSVVPEPSTIGLLGLSSLGLVLRRRFRS